jgi:hypothetical protein
VVQRRRLVFVRECPWDGDTLFGSTPSSDETGDI